MSGLRDRRLKRGYRAMAKAKILIVEDDTIVAEDIKRTLKDLGYAVSKVVSSGEDALNIAKKKRPDLVLMDIMLGGEMDGIEAADQIHSQLNFPIVYLTAYADKNMLDRAKITEPFGYIVKPFSDRELHSAIEIALYKHKTEEALQKAHDGLEQQVAERTVELETASELLRQELENSKQAEEGLRKSEAQVRLLLDSTAEAIFGLDLDGNCTFANPACLRLLGYDNVDDLIGKNMHGLIHHTQIDGNPYPQEECRACRIFQTGERIHVEDEVLWRSDGTCFPTEYRAHPIYADGHIIGSVVTFLDITKRKSALDELRKSKDQYQRLVEGTPGILYSFSDKRGGVFYSSRVESILGYPVTHLYDNPTLWHDSIHPDDIEKVDQAVEDFAGGKDFDLEYRIRDASGNLHWFRDRSIGRRKKNGEVIIEGLVIDFTEQKRANEEKEGLTRQLQQGHKMEAIGTLAGGIAHDFNNILGAIVGHGEIMELFEIPEDHKMRSSLKEILNAAYRAKDLVEQILTFSRQSQQEKKAILFTPVIKEALRLLRASLPSTIEIRQDIENISGTVFADSTQMHQVLMNLGTNAAHAMRREGGVMEVSLSAIDHDPENADSISNLQPGRYFQLDVKDTGHGMIPEIMERIFDPYYTTKEKDKGTGLGLSVVHGIVKSHGGEITVESRLGKGSAFHVFLPLIETNLVDTELEQFKPLPTGKGCVLFVDDEKPLVDFGKEILEHLGYEVVARTSSIEALEVFNAQPDRFDLVITDMTMPNMTGYDLAKTIIQTRPELPVILCTGFSEIVTPETAKAAGIKEFIQKPIGVREFAKTIQRVLGEND